MKEEEQKPKIKRPRIKSVRSQMQTVIEQLDRIAANPEMKIAKKADAVFQKASLLATIYGVDSEERKAKIKFADVEKLSKENADLKAEIARLTAELNSKTPAKTDGLKELTFEERLKRHGIGEESHV